MKTVAEILWILIKLTLFIAFAPLLLLIGWEPNASTPVRIVD